MAVDKERLRELAADPARTMSSIAQELGVSNLYYEFQKDATLKAVYEEGRAEARAAQKPSSRDTPVQRATKGRGRKKRAEDLTPPRNGNAKGGVSRELLRKLILEFNHLDVYGKVSEHFQEIREEMGALL